MADAFDHGDEIVGNKVVDLAALDRAAQAVEGEFEFERVDAAAGEGHLHAGKTEIVTHLAVPAVNENDGRTFLPIASGAPENAMRVRTIPRRFDDGIEFKMAARGEMEFGRGDFRREEIGRGEKFGGAIGLIWAAPSGTDAGRGGLDAHAIERMLEECDHAKLKFAA